VEIIQKNVGGTLVALELENPHPGKIIKLAGTTSEYDEMEPAYSTVH